MASITLRSGLVALGLTLLGVSVASSCTSPDFIFELPSGAGAGGVSSIGGSAGMAGEGGEGPVVAHCQNRALDPSETDLDCGGADCPPCEIGQICVLGRDCENGSCVSGECQDPRCNDTEVNGEETDLGCGGTQCPKCDTGQTCLVAEDCMSHICENTADGRRCAEPTCDDSVLNGDESDVDCGGDLCDGCEVGDNCRTTDDCEEASSGAALIRCGSDDRCELLCGDGAADCNKSPIDACETNLRTDLTHCGGCDQECDLAHASESCQGGSCVLLECSDGFWSCNGEDDDGCEVDLRQDPDNCGACAYECPDTNGTPSCVDRQCTIECDDGYDNCNGEIADGCETDLNLDVDNCGECDNVCTGTSTAIPHCNGTCGTTVCQTPNTGDCDGDGSICESDLTTVNNCGRCGNRCTVPHADPGCADGGSGYQCSVGVCHSDASADWEDCDGQVANGCEVNLLTDRNRCGACNNDCTDLERDASKHVAQAGCSAGGCTIISCATGWANCDGGVGNGCEVNINTSSTHCGGCNTMGGLNCNTAYANGTGTCVDGLCNFEQCNSGRGDCNQDAVQGPDGNGCETILTNNQQHCGACDNTCVEDARTSTNTCNGTTCTPVCSNNTNFANCDMQGPNGCETDKRSDEENCGGCGIECQVPNAQTVNNTCNSSTCTPGCASGYASCDSNPNNGCEQSLSVVAHCGDCADACSGAGSGTASCNSSGQCSVTCGADFKSCNNENTARDGCETDVRSNLSNCGACSSACSGANGGTASCGSGQCSVSCGANFKSCNNENTARDGCETDIRSNPNHCGGCGNVCSGTRPFCVDGQCIPCSNPRTPASSNNSGDFNTLGAVCYRVTDQIQGWGCNSMGNYGGSRGVWINGKKTSLDGQCGEFFPEAPAINGYHYLQAGPGEFTWATFHWWCGSPTCPGP